MASSPQAYANWQAKKAREQMNTESKSGTETPGVGHNSVKVPTSDVKAFTARIKGLQEEKKAIADDIRDVYAEAKEKGLNVKALRAVIRESEQDPQERAELEQVKDLYREALDMLA